MEYHSLQVGRNHRMKRRHKKISAPTRMKQIVTEHTITITNCNHTVLIKRRQFVHNTTTDTIQRQISFVIW